MTLESSFQLADLIKHDGKKKKGDPPKFGVGDHVIADLLTEVVLLDEEIFRPQTNPEAKRDEEE